MPMREAQPNIETFVTEDPLKLFAAKVVADVEMHIVPVLHVLTEAVHPEVSQVEVEVWAAECAKGSISCSAQNAYRLARRRRIAGAVYSE